MDNETSTEFTAFPSYTVQPVPRLVPWLSDFHLSLLLPVAAYWFISLIFWYIDKKDYFARYRLHTPEEFKQRNRVTAAEVLRSVLLQQAVQTALGLFLGYVTEAGDFRGREEYDIAVWAGRIRRASDAIPWVLALVGIDAMTLAHQLRTYTASLNNHGGAMGKSFQLMTSIISPRLGDGLTYGFTAWEVSAAKMAYWVLEPAARFGVAVCFSDSWQYFWHRAMHSNKWLYREFFLPSSFLVSSSPFPPKTSDPGPFENPETHRGRRIVINTGNVHAHHHKIYVPYAFGAFYNTLAEAFVLDTIGTTVSLMLSGLTIRQTMCFSTISVLKGVDDHCGYRLPWDPLQWLGEQDTRFHDVHHQSWGIKVCDFLPFWSKFVLRFIMKGGGCWTRHL
ncbi:MAG: hypothetical protein Q9173_007169 [Seirophora scorigena]